MQTSYILFSLIFPICLEGCCPGNHQTQRKTGVHQSLTQPFYYRAVEGEVFMLPCFTSVHQDMKAVCFLTGGDGKLNGDTSFQCGRKFLAEAKHSGNYTCVMNGSRLVVHLQVVEKSSLGCYQPEESTATLVVGIGGKINCPGLNCSDNTNVIWYKGNKAVSEQHRSSCEENGQLHLCDVREQDTGIYFCERHIMEQGVRRIFRRAVNVTAIPYKTTSRPPTIIYPNGNTTEEVELGHSHTLVCQVLFPFEKEFVPHVRWYLHHGGNMDSRTLLDLQRQEKKDMTLYQKNVTQIAVIKEVTAQHLNNTYTCVANNTVGECSVTMRLRQRIKVKWPRLVGYPIASSVLVAGLGIFLYKKRLELQLIYRSHFQHGKHAEGEKDFDVFLSYVPSTEEGEDDEEACLSSVDPLDTEGKASQRPLGLLLSQVLEEQWGYHLCLLERDVLPGGAYTDDVVVSIQRSRMLICVLSAEYLSNTNTVFVLESGVQALLQNATFKILLIWTSPGSSSLIQPDPPLPTLVLRALKVLPSLYWPGDKPGRVSRNFWRSLKSSMPQESG